LVPSCICTSSHGEHDPRRGCCWTTRGTRCCYKSINTRSCIVLAYMLVTCVYGIPFCLTHLPFLGVSGPLFSISRWVFRVLSLPASILSEGAFLLQSPRQRWQPLLPPPPSPPPPRLPLANSAARLRAQGCLPQVLYYYYYHAISLSLLVSCRCLHAIHSRHITFLCFGSRSGNSKRAVLAFYASLSFNCNFYNTRPYLNQSSTKYVLHHGSAKLLAGDLCRSVKCLFYQICIWRRFHALEPAGYTSLLQESTSCIVIQHNGTVVQFFLVMWCRWSGVHLKSFQRHLGTRSSLSEASQVTTTSFFCYIMAYMKQTL
jgi:hypothetical protein